MECQGAMYWPLKVIVSATWMDLEIVILSEVGQRKTNIGYLLYVKSKKKLYKLIYKTETDSQI